MNDFAIRVEGISKQFRIGGLNSSRSLRGFLENIIRTPLRIVPGSPHVQPDHLAKAGYFWALKNVSFTIRPGQVVGLVGHNGAGKTVLLKILSRVTRPTAGYAETRGRIGAMLGAGVGFHYELTGRENIYLTGAILRMKWSDVARKFDDIVAFSGVETFLDTPIKRYSSGMTVRLAFAVAFYLEPEILIVDEAFTVEDAAFTAKCRTRIWEMAASGKTILIVSHNQTVIKDLCDRALLLDHGQLTLDGKPDEVLAYYNQYITK